MVKALLIIIDGGADRALKSLGRKTPFEVANTPNMDKLAASGVTGVFNAVSLGLSVGSDTSHLAIFGYDPYETYSGRGAFEALGSGLDLKPGDIAFRTNFATVDDELKIIDRRAGRYIEEAKELEEAINSIELSKHKDIGIFFKHTVEHRGVLIIRGPGLSRMISDTDPHKVGAKVLECKPLDKTVEARKTAEIVNEFTQKVYDVLRRHPANQRRKNSGKPPANILLLRGAGTLPNIQPLSEKYGIKAAAIAGIALIKGIARAVGMNIINVPGATGGLDTNVYSKVYYAAKALNEHDFVFLHFKGADAASHDGKAWAKVRMIERIDSAIGYLLEMIDISKIYIVITCDHATLTEETRDHSGDITPLLISGGNIIADSVAEFNERACMKGGLGKVTGRELMTLLMNYLNRIEKFGE